jgi:ferredoxin
MRVKMIIGVVLVGLFVMLSGCASKSAEHHDHNNVNQAAANVDEKELEKFFAKSESELSEQHPIYVDKDKKTVKVFAKVNGKYLVQPTRHGLNWVEGKYGNQSVFHAYANPLAFFKALKEIGGIPAVDQGGDASKEFNVTPEGKFIKGDPVAVTITWQGAGKEYNINDVMVDSTGKKLEYHFGGNFDAAANMMTGCFMCFDSCPVGILSNANQPVNAFSDGKAEFHGNPKVLPKDGTAVVLTYAINK